jgi:hypothetical protein
MTSDRWHVVRKVLSPPDTVEVRVSFRRFGRSDPKRALAQDLARTISSSTAVGSAQGDRVNWVLGIGPTKPDVRHIEVKGSGKGVTSITVTRNAVLYIIN